MSVLEQLEAWYAAQCDGDWEHQNGVTIGTLDNPGWRVDISLEGTDLANVPFERVEMNREESDWVHCWVANNHFQGRGGPSNLAELLATFLDWSGT